MSDKLDLEDKQLRVDKMTQDTATVAAVAALPSAAAPPAATVAVADDVSGGGSLAHVEQPGAATITTIPSCSAQQPLHLLDCPGPFLVRLLHHVDEAGLLALLSTCWRTNDLVLQQCRKLQADLLSDGGGDDVVQELQLASNCQQRISLVLQGTKRTILDSPPEPGETLQGDSQHLDLDYALVIGKGHSLGILLGVTRLELNGLDLDAPLPAALGVSCPRLTNLNVSYCLFRLNQARPDSFAAAFPHLQTLTFHYVWWLGSITEWAPKLQQQVAQLSGLTSLELNGFRNADHPPKQADLYSVILDGMVPTVAEHLTHLRLGWHHDDGLLPDVYWEERGLGSYLTTLHSLDIEASIGNDMMEQLLQLPCLHHLTVWDFKYLTRSFAGQACGWMTLAIMEFSVQDLAWLPLHSNLVIRVAPDYDWDCHLHFNTYTYPREDVSVELALENIKHSGWPGWHGHGMTIHVRLGDDRYQKHAVQALPLLDGISHLVLEAADMSSTTVNALANFAATQAHGFKVTLHGVGYWQAEQPLSWDCAEMCRLVAHMPTGGRLTVEDIDKVTFDRLCHAAKLGITIKAVRSKRVIGPFFEGMKCI